MGRRVPKRPVRGLGDAGLFEAERREQHAQPLDLVFVRRGDVLQAAARRRAVRSPPPRLARIAAASDARMLGQQAQASAPFRQRLARLRKQPGNFADDRKAAAAGAAHPAGALQRDWATPAARTGKDTRQ